MFRSFDDIASDVSGVLSGLKLFKNVDVAAVSTGEQLVKQLASISPLPAAIVCIGSGDFEGSGLERKATVAIIVVADYSKTGAGRAANVWGLVDAVTEAFAPSVDPATGEPLWQTLNDVHYVPRSWTPVDSPALRVAAFAVELETHELAAPNATQP